MPRMTGGRFIAETFQAYGVTHVFFMPVIIQRGLVEMERLGIHRIMVHSEKSAAYMADGYARTAQRVGVCMSQSVGAANLAAGLQDPYLGCSPVMAGRAYLHNNNGARTLTARHRSNCSMFRSGTGDSQSTPAFDTRTSMRPNRSKVASIRCSISLLWLKKSDTMTSRSTCTVRPIVLERLPRSLQIRSAPPAVR